MPVPVASDRPSRPPWALFVVAAAWSVVIRVPLILNAAHHLDSDLAVDGLTLLDATRGRWRWHYPGTPFIGAGPVLLSLPQAWALGVSPSTLVSGGAVAWLGLMLATFVLAGRTFGPRVAGWSLVPLTFASTGAVWLSGRITGGHLTAAAWHAGAFALLAGRLNRNQGATAAAALGFWCGLGLTLDSMFALTLAGIIPAAFGFWRARGAPRSGARRALVFLAALLAGVWPRFVGARVDPHDAYRDQFALAASPELLSTHARLLAMECLPRLIAGHRLPGLESDPDPAALSAAATARNPATPDALGACAVGLTTALGFAALAALVRASVAGRSTATRAVVQGLLVSAAATLVGFVANRNIFNSDNYRYLVGLLVPWSLGFGLVADGLMKRGRGGVAVASGLAVVLAVVMTADLARWYARFGWLDDRGRPVRAPWTDPVLDWLDAHPEIQWIEGGYWDVYRLSFLTRGRVRGAPFPVYPDRFPEWRPTPGAPRTTIIRPTPDGRVFRDAAIRAGARVVARFRGATILSGP